MKKKNLILLSAVLVVTIVLSIVLWAGRDNSSQRSYVFEVGGVMLDLTKVAERFYKDSYLTDDAVYNRFKDYAEGLNKYLSASNDVKTAYPDEEYGFQLDAPKEGEEIAIMHTNMGDIYIRFFPEAAPKAVENFKTHAKNGYYNGVKFHKILKDFVLQTGDPTGLGDGGESIWGEDFETEFDQKLLNLKGAISMAKTGNDKNASQFFINRSDSGISDYKAQYDIANVYADYVYTYEHKLEVNRSLSNPAISGRDFLAEFLAVYPDLDSFIEKYYTGLKPLSHLVPDEVWDLYNRVGGNIQLDGAWRSMGGHTVFAQVFDGSDTVETIANTAADLEGNTELDVIINSIEIVNYTK